jgi:sirohydrochlorin ferrochelatase
LADQLVAAARHTPDQTLILVPLFMGGGIHVQVDLPAAIAEAQEKHSTLTVIQTQPIGETPEILQVLQHRMQAQTDAADAWILLGHGSRASGLAHHLASVIEHLTHSHRCIRPAFWAQSPRLAHQVEALYVQGSRRIHVLPFFLFPGGIFYQIAVEAILLEQQCPHLQIKVDRALAPDPLLIKAVQRCVATAGVLPV